MAEFTRLNGPRYTLEYGSYYLRDPVRSGDRILAMVDQVSMAYSKSEIGTVLHRHGSQVDVEQWVTKKRKELLESGCEELAADLVMVTFPRGFDVEKINRCLSTSGYLGILLMREMKHG